MNRLRDSSDLTQREARTRGLSRRIPQAFARANGAILVDADGKRYLDFIAGAGSLNYGHNDPDLVAALLRHLQDQGLGAGLDVHSTAKQRFLRAFCGHVLGQRQMSHRVQFTGPSPVDALEAGLRLARRITGRDAVIAFSHAELVPTDHPLATAWRHPFDGVFGPEVDTAAQLAALLDEPGSGMPKPAAIVFETMARGAQLQPARPQWVRALAQIARRHGALLVCDDSRLGGGRLGPFFSFEGMGVMPDLVVPTASLSGLGLPMSVLLVRPDRDLWSSTEERAIYLHNHHGFVTGAATCDKFWSDDRLQRQAEQRAELLRAALAVTAGLLPGTELIGAGMLQGLLLPDPALANQLMQRCTERGLLVEVAGIDGRQVRLEPPVTVPTLVLEQGLAILHRCFSEVVGRKTDSDAHKALRAVLRGHASPPPEPAGLA